jgi:hypothetical protein
MQRPGGARWLVTPGFCRGQGLQPSLLHCHCNHTWIKLQRLRLHRLGLLLLWLRRLGLLLLGLLLLGLLLLGLLLRLLLLLRRRLRLRLRLRRLRRHMRLLLLGLGLELGLPPLPCTAHRLPTLHDLCDDVFAGPHNTEGVLERVLGKQ